MKGRFFSESIKELRLKNGLSQEQLSEFSGLSLRSIQRIENGETRPRGDSLRKLADVFGISPDDFAGAGLREDQSFLTDLNLSSLSFLLFPPLGFLLPMIFWFAGKDKVRGARETGVHIMNFQLTWILQLFVGHGIILIRLEGVFVIPSSILSFGIVLYLYNVSMIIINTIRIRKGKDMAYFPQIKFFRSFA